MKKRIISLMMTFTLAVGMLAVGPQVVKADKHEGEAYDDSPTTVYKVDSDDYADEDDGSIVGVEDISVQAAVTGTEKKIRYSVTVSHGAMKFTYDYGMVWNPSTHKYEKRTASASSSVEAGWNIADVNGTNNLISVVNDSNYPVDVDLKFEFTEDTTNYVDSFFDSNDESGTVDGYFTHDLDKLKALVRGDSGADAAFEGVKFTGASLDINDSRVKEQLGAVYGVLDARVDDGSDPVEAAALPNSGKYYFAFAGVPAKTTKFDMKAVGTITVTITPTPSGVTIHHVTSSTP